MLVMKSKSELLIEQLQNEAHDKHAALQRLSLQTGYPLEVLEKPAELTEEQTVAVEAAVKRILGKDELGG